MGLPRWVGRAIGLDVHRDFCEVAICEDGVVRSAGRVPSTPERITALGESLLRSDRHATPIATEGSGLQPLRQYPQPDSNRRSPA